MDPEVGDGLNSNQKLGQEKRVLVLVNGRVDFDANKQNAGHKINMTPRKIQSPIFSLPVNHRQPPSSAF